MHRHRANAKNPGFDRGSFFLSLDRVAEYRGVVQPIASKRLASTFLRTFSGSQMRPFIAM